LLVGDYQGLAARLPKTQKQAVSTFELKLLERATRGAELWTSAGVLSEIDHHGDVLSGPAVTGS
jgi:hypothetical protein